MSGALPATHSRTPSSRFDGLSNPETLEPVEAGVLDWLEVHELHEVVAGELPGRQSPDDIVLFKSNGIAAWDVAIAAAAVEGARARGLPTDD